MGEIKNQIGLKERKHKKGRGKGEETEKKISGGYIRYETDRQTDSQTDRQTDRQTHTHTLRLNHHSPLPMDREINVKRLFLNHMACPL